MGVLIQITSWQRRLLLRNGRALSDRQWARLKTMFATDDPTGEWQQSDGPRFAEADLDREHTARLQSFRRRVRERWRYEQEQTEYHEGDAFSHTHPSLSLALSFKKVALEAADGKEEDEQEEQHEEG